MSSFVIVLLKTSVAQKEISADNHQRRGESNLHSDDIDIRDIVPTTEAWAKKRLREKRAEATRRYRQRKKESWLKPPAKTPAEHSKAYRERQKLKRAAASGAITPPPIPSKKRVWNTRSLTSLKRKEREQKNRAETLVTPDDIEKRKNDEQGLSSDPLDTTENIEKRKNDEQGLSSDPLDTTENIEIPIEEIKIEEIKIEETEILSEDDPGLDYGPSTSINSTLILPGTSSKNNFDFEEKIKSIKKEEVECAEDLPIAPIEFNVAGFSCMQLKPNKRKRSCSSDRAASASLVEDSQNTASDDDALDLTGKIIANKLRRFPKKVRIIAEKLLNDVLYLAELGNLNENSMIVTKHC